MSDISYIHSRIGINYKTSLCVACFPWSGPHIRFRSPSLPLSFPSNSQHFFQTNLRFSCSHIFILHQVFPSISQHFPQIFMDFPRFSPGFPQAFLCRQVLPQAVAWHRLDIFEALELQRRQGRLLLTDRDRLRGAFPPRG